jgi:hypothetical protein
MIKRLKLISWKYDVSVIGALVFWTFFSISCFGFRAIVAYGLLLIFCILGQFGWIIKAFMKNLAHPSAICLRQEFPVHRKRMLGFFVMMFVLFVNE